jgi:hypothetical protein
MDRKIVERLRAGAGINELARELKVSKRRIVMVRALAEEAGYFDGVRLPTYPEAVFAEKPDINYLIEQMFDLDLTVDAGTAHKNYSLPFNHPVKELVCAIQRNSNDSILHPFDFWGINGDNYTVDLTISAKIQFNLIERFKEREGTYFRCVQPYQYHTGGNKQVGSISPLPVPYADYQVEPFGGFYIYSFSLKPELHQPSGSCNFSRIDNAVLLLNASSQANNIRIWAKNYNVLNIMSGMAGIVYSN